MDFATSFMIIIALIFTLPMMISTFSKMIRDRKHPDDKKWMDGLKK